MPLVADQPNVMRFGVPSFCRVVTNTSVIPTLDLITAYQAQNIIFGVYNSSAYYQRYVGLRNLSSAVALPPALTSESLREYVKSTGQDYDEMLNAAARHFESGTIVRNQTDLTDAELESLIDDDQSHFGT